MAPTIFLAVRPRSKPRGILGSSSSENEEFPEELLGELLGELLVEFLEELLLLEEFLEELLEEFLLLEELLELLIELAWDWDFCEKESSDLSS